MNYHKFLYFFSLNKTNLKLFIRCNGDLFEMRRTNFPLCQKLAKYDKLFKDFEMWANIMRPQEQEFTTLERKVKSEYRQDCICKVREQENQSQHLRRPKDDATDESEILFWRCLLCNSLHVIYQRCPQTIAQNPKYEPR